MITPQHHREISERFLEQAEFEFQAGDLLQASEKAWGAFSHCVSAIARRRGWRIGSHHQLMANARRIIQLDADCAANRNIQVLALNGLHANFYNSHLDADVVRLGIDHARELVSALTALDETNGYGGV